MDKSIRREILANFRQQLPYIWLPFVIQIPLGMYFIFCQELVAVERPFPFYIPTFIYFLLQPFVLALISGTILSRCDPRLSQLAPLRVIGRNAFRLIWLSLRLSFMTILYALLLLIPGVVYYARRMFYIECLLAEPEKSAQPFEHSKALVQKQRRNFWIVWLTAILFIGSMPTFIRYGIGIAGGEMDWLAPENNLFILLVANPLFYAIGELLRIALFRVLYEPGFTFKAAE